MNSTMVRLLDQFQPKKYQIKFEFLNNKKNYSGNTIIKGKYHGTDKTLKLHCKDLRIIGVNINNKAYDYKLVDDVLVVQRISDSLINKHLSINIDYSGTVTSKMHGIYTCNSQASGIIIATQFESHHAREAFPCIDEPSAKATFDIEITTKKSDIVISNMPVLKSSTLKENKHTIFKTTPIMSSYLVAFVIGDLHRITGKTDNGTIVSVWSSKDHPKSSLKFALKTSIKSIEFLNKYFDTPYPLPKCDQVALPDFSSGAMENWGLITYREVCLLVDPKTTSSNGQEYVATVIAHELSHQWFGNLVTMKWWNDLWLNESFATLMEYIITDSLFPKWNIMLSFTAHEALSAFRRDMLPGIQAVESDINHPDQISTLFDPSIVYAKGSRLLLMAYTLVGDKAFRKGLKNYFKKFAYKNTEGTDLWQELSVASGKRVTSIMQTWIKTPGFPVVRVKQIGKDLSLRQRPLRTIKANGNAPIWPIPLSPKPKTSLIMLKDFEKNITLKSETYVQINTDAGHYSVHYETQPHRKALLSKVKNKTMSPVKRLLFINDQLMLARSGIIGMDEAMDILSGFTFETEEPVWSVISLAISDAKKLIENDELAEQSLKTFTWNFVENEYQKLGWHKLKNEQINITKLRGVILSLAAYSDEPSVISASLKEYYSYNSLEEIPADTRHIILNSAVKNGPTKIFNKLYDVYPKATNAELASDIAGALSSTKSIASINKLLNSLTDSKFVRLQDVNKFIIYLMFNKNAKNLTWQWLKTNWQWIIDNFKSDKSYDNYPRYTATAFNTEKQLNDYVKFFTPLKKEPALTRNIELGLAEIKNRVAWRKRDEKNLIIWLTNQQLH